MLQMTFDEQNIGRALAYIERAGMAGGILEFQRKFFTRLGALTLAWIGQNFETGGQLVGGWAPLRPSTVFGRLGGSNRPLMNKGRLRQSFVVTVTDTELTVGSPSQIALYHNLGTRPYDIYPKNGKALAFPSMQGNVVRTRPLGSPRVGMLSGNRQSMTVVRHVHHPGLPARRMIPNTAEVRPLIREALQSLRGESRGLD